MRFQRRQFLRTAGSALALAGASKPAFAQSYPVRPITVVSLFPAGSPQDIILRSLADIVAADLKQPIVTENKPGGFGAAQNYTAIQKPDGYTLGATASASLVVLPLIRKIPYDPLNDLTIIMQLATFPLGIAVKADSRFKAWPDVVAYAKANPGIVTFGTNAPDSVANMGMMRLQNMAGISLTSVPFKGSMDAMSAVLGDQVALFVSGAEWKPQVDAGAMRLLMMWTDKRLPAYANTPTARESGYPFDLDVSMDLIAPKGVEPAMVKVAHDAYKKALETESIRALIEKYDMIPNYADGPALKARLTAMSTDLQPIVAQLGLSPKE